MAPIIFPIHGLDFLLLIFTVTIVTCNNRYMSSRKEELLEEVVQYLLENGVASLSLRPLAQSLGTSPRMLLFHFKSKEGLLREVIQEVNQRLQSKLEGMAYPQADQTKNALSLFWQWATRKDTMPYFRLLYEAQIVATLNPEEYAAVFRQSSMEWRKLALRSMSPSLREPALADLCVAVFDGLLLECILSGERRRLTAALDRFIAMLRK
jgi:AcrR family transcriptional regulator